MVFFFDESRFGLKPHIGRCWARKGVTMQVPVNPAYQNFSIFSGVSPITGDSFSLFLPNVNTQTMNIYLEELSKAYADCNLMLIMDQAGWHKSHRLKLPNNIQITYLPPYSPELNPVERLRNWLKKHVCRNRLFACEETLMDVLAENLRFLSPTRLTELCACNYLLH
jgi:transposase